MSQRLDKVRTKLAEGSLDALLVSTPENRRYVSGFTGSAGYLLISPDTATVATDFRYIEQAGQQAQGFDVLRIGGDYAWFPDLLAKLGARKVGFESTHLTVASYRQLVEVVRKLPSSQRPTLVPTSGIIEGLRAVKEQGELEPLKRAIDAADRAFAQVAPTIQPGMTEREVAWRLEQAMHELGADGPSFDTIVGSGPNGALPHHHPSDKPIAQGEPIVIDMGARVDGYCSDMTRTICLGQPDETFRKVYDIVLGAQLTAIATVRAGITGEEGDGLARQVIAEAGYGDNFGHGLGHGVGLEIHEAPRLGTKAANRLEEGMVFTIEPGIYLSGWGGVRIEDVVILERGGARTLSKAPKLERMEARR